MSDHPFKVHTLRETTLRDGPAGLRQLADDIESGKYGKVGCVGAVILGDTLEVFGWGDGLMRDGIGPSVATLFAAGNLRLVKSIEEHGK